MFLRCEYARTGKPGCGSYGGNRGQNCRSGPAPYERIWSGAAVLLPALSGGLRSRQTIEMPGQGPQAKAEDTQMNDGPDAKGDMLGNREDGQSDKQREGPLPGRCGLGLQDQCTQEGADENPGQIEADQVQQ